MSIAERWICRQTKRPIDGPRVCLANKAARRKQCMSCVNEARLEFVENAKPGASTPPKERSARPDAAGLVNNKSLNPPAGAAAPGNPTINTAADGCMTPTAPAPSPPSRGRSRGGPVRCLECGAKLERDRLEVERCCLRVTIRAATLESEYSYVLKWPLCDSPACMRSAIELVEDLEEASAEILGGPPAARRFYA